MTIGVSADSPGTAGNPIVVGSGTVTATMLDPVTGNTIAIRPATSDGMSSSNVQAVNPALWNTTKQAFDRLPGDSLNGEYVNLRRYPDEQAETLRAILDELRVITFYLKEGLGVSDEPDAIRADLAVTSPPQPSLQ